MRIVRELIKTVLHIILMFPIYLLGAWMSMLWLGVVHHSFDDRVPAFGFWTCFFLLYALVVIPATAIASNRIYEALDDAA